MTSIHSWVALFVWIVTLASPASAASVSVSTRRAQPDDFGLVENGRAAVIIHDEKDAKLVGIAAGLFRDDVKAITAVEPLVTNRISGVVASNVVLIGTIGRSQPLDALVRSGRFDVAGITGGWERFKIAVVNDPFPGIQRALVIAGSDRRGAAFGVFSLSEAMGVSPWHWWADVVPATQSNLFIPATAYESREPSVRYRGMFINDEDWGMQPWAANAFENGPGEVKDIGPKTYAKVFELLLRLRANTLWPAMHACTKPFNTYPENARLADDYGIVMGSSHAEPMLRNNVGEWTAPASEYNYHTHSNQVLDYWERRVRENGQFENVYTLGMRGIHDSRMQGPRGRGDQIRLLEQIFADQRALLRRHVSTNLETVPQVFCAYKEVLDVYRGGLKVPDDVTIMFPDDNFGYIRTFATAQERQRSGGAGVYYHISYLGRPLAYLWLCTTPPALIWQEMSKAYEQGAQRMWIVNVGDIKPAELGTEFFLKLAWDVNQWGATNVSDFVRYWAAREFGTECAGEIADIKERYYRLNHQRKPEHLQWWLPNEEPRPSPWSDRRVEDRLRAFDELVQRVEQVESKVPPQRRDAFFQLVKYPVIGSALANRRYFLGERGMPEAERADAELKELTRQFNEEIANGKWRGFMQLEPADNQWRGMRISPWRPRQLRPEQTERNASNTVISIEAEHHASRRDVNGAGWRVVHGLGPSGDSITVLPTTVATPGTNQLSGAPRVTYEVPFARSGEYHVTLRLVPTFPITGSVLRIGMGMGEDAPQLLELPRQDGSTEWAQGVLNAHISVTGRIHVASPGRQSLHIFMAEPGVVLDEIEIQ